MTVIEVCVTDTAGIEAAYAGGADRVELCVNLEVGGLTPPDTLITQAIEIISGFPRNFELRLLIREHHESFIHDQTQQKQLVTEVKRLREKLAQAPVKIGFVVGALNTNKKIPTEFLQEMKAAADGWALIFHRGIDACSDRAAGLQALVDNGFTGVLTTGGPESVADPTALALEQHTYKDKLRIIASGGVRAHNAAEILRKSNAPEIHFRAPYADGQAGTDPALVAAIVSEIRKTS